MNNVMLDLETMGKGPRAAIVTIGAVFFDPMTGELGAEFEAHIHLRDSARFGEMDPDSVLWWLAQGDEARSSIIEPKYRYAGEMGRLKLTEALLDFCDWIDEHGQKVTAMWGNGAGFDNVILANAYHAVDIKTPWSFWQDRDVRTIVELGRTLRGFDPKKDMPFEGVRHSALDDAKHQARYVSAIYQALAATRNEK
ncbi:ATPase [Aeromonas salmonicida subsp. smithia]|uniref:3'-5' exonuclease n=1 Tax=Aeromonas salmonicida TaxID=645 RepID=UPI00073044E8|nr:3'-5' exonuclease [Aeromonas salmonicida]KTA92499.1 ATPase [Aeromonas salmonicida subsp. smithia]